MGSAVSDVFAIRVTYPDGRSALRVVGDSSEVVTYTRREADKSARFLADTYPDHTFTVESVDHVCVSHERVAIVGSREYGTPENVRSYVASLPAGTLIVSGGARGVDTIAAEAALSRGLPLRVIPADWTHYGKSAGYRRNVEIVDACDRVVAFWNGTSPGTRHTIEIARKAGKSVEVIRG